MKERPPAASITPFKDRDWVCEWCKRCDRRIVVGFSVADDVWNAVTGDPNTCWCTTCFDEEAQRNRIPYTFAGVYPVSWNEGEKAG